MGTQGLHPDRLPPTPVLCALNHSSGSRQGVQAPLILHFVIFSRQCLRNPTVLVNFKPTSHRKRRQREEKRRENFCVFQ